MSFPIGGPDGCDVSFIISLPPRWENKKPTAGLAMGWRLFGSFSVSSPTANGMFAGDITPRGDALRHGRQRQTSGVGDETIHSFKNVSEL